jgi:hypothetical protein
MMRSVRVRRREVRVFQSLPARRAKEEAWIILLL